MKHTEEIATELEGLYKTDRRDMLPKQLKSINKRIAFLNVCKNYLQTNPREEFIKSEITRLQKRLDKIKAGFAAYESAHEGSGLNYGQLLSQYQSEMKVNHQKLQLKTLKFLLK